MPILGGGEGGIERNQQQLSGDAAVLREINQSPVLCTNSRVFVFRPEIVDGIRVMRPRNAPQEFGTGAALLAAYTESFN